MDHVSSVRTVDGSTLSVGLPDTSPDTVLGWGGHVRYAPAYGGRATTQEVWGLELAPLSALGSGIQSVKGSERARLSLAGGELVVYDCGDPSDARWAAWLGPWNMAHGLFHSPVWETECQWPVGTAQWRT